MVLNKATDRVVLSRLDERGAPIPLTDHRLPDTRDKEFCQRCHRPGNAVGAAAAVLPSKSLLCLPCHYAPIAVGHPLFWTALIIFGLGLLLTGMFWFSGSVQGEEKSVTPENQPRGRGGLGHRLFPGLLVHPENGFL